MSISNEQKEKMILMNLIARKPNTCGQCFCNDLCMFLLMKTGVVTTCEDFQRRVRKVVDREIDKVSR